MDLLDFLARDPTELPDGEKERALAEGEQLLGLPEALGATGAQHQAADEALTR